MKQNKRFFYFLSIIFLIIACKPKPTYNPFDEVFDVSIYDLIADKCDSVIGECGYFNMTKKIEGIDLSYQYFNNEKDIKAKGCKYIVDSLDWPYKNSMDYESLLDSLLTNMPINKALLEKKFKKFGVTVVNIQKGEYFTKSIDFKRYDNQIIKGYFDVRYLENEKKIVRYLTVFRGNREKPKSEGFLNKLIDYF